MKIKSFSWLALIMVSFSALSAPKFVVAHRGASGYLPEHTLEAKTLAYSQGADYLEQDVVLTKDNRLIVLHDLYLDNITDVAQKFPHKARADGKFYAIDFTLDEIEKLRATSPFKMVNGKIEPVYPNRFPVFSSNFRIHTLEDEIELIQGLNKSTSQNRGLFIEIKNPIFHRQEGRDISQTLLNAIKKYGYTSKNDNIYIQCFDPNELKRIHSTIGPESGVNVKLTQLIAYTGWNSTKEFKNGQWMNYDFDWMLKPEGMHEISKYADAISPAFLMLIKNKDGKISVSHLTKYAHKNGLKVIPFTISADALPDYAKSADYLYDLLFKDEGVDGIFSDHPDQTVNYLKRNNFR